MIGMSMMKAGQQATKKTIKSIDLCYDLIMVQ